MTKKHWIITGVVVAILGLAAIFYFKSKDGEAE